MIILHVIQGMPFSFDDLSPTTELKTHLFHYYAVCLLQRRVVLVSKCSLPLPLPIETRSPFSYLGVVICRSIRLLMQNQPPLIKGLLQ